MTPELIRLKGFIDDIAKNAPDGNERACYRSLSALIATFDPRHLSDANRYSGAIRDGNAALRTYNAINMVLRDMPDVVVKRTTVSYRRS